MSDLELDLDQIIRLEEAFRHGNWLNKDIKLACTGDYMARFRDVVRGHAKITPIKHVVDCDADPFAPAGLGVMTHKKGGQLLLDPSKIKLHLSPNQKNGKLIKGAKLYEELKELMSESLLNANVLDYYLAHCETFPEDWKYGPKPPATYLCEYKIFFWGTIYFDKHDYLCVRSLHWDDDDLIYEGHCRLIHEWNEDSPAAILVS